MAVLDSRASMQTVQELGPCQASVPMVLEGGGNGFLRITILRECAGNAGNPALRYSALRRDSIHLAAHRVRNARKQCHVIVNPCRISVRPAKATVSRPWSSPSAHRGKIM